MTTMNTNNKAVAIDERIKRMPRDCIKCDGPDCIKTNPRHRCSKCRCSYYCSAECQRNDWPTHKSYCNPIDEMKAKHQQAENNNSNKEEPPKAAADDDASNNNHDDDSAQPQKKKSGFLNDECTICLSKPIVEPVILRECKHAFCSSCLLQWQQFQKTTVSYVIDMEEEKNDDDDNNNNNKEKKVRRAKAPCPCCRTETTNDDDVENSLLTKAMLLATRAHSSKIKPNEEKRQQYLLESLTCLNELLSSDVPNPRINAYFTKAEILMELKDPQGAADVIQTMFQVDEERKQHIVMKLLDQQDEAVSRFDRAEYERLKEEIVLAAEEYGMPATRMSNQAYWAAYTLLCQAYEALEKWEEALEVYNKLGMLSEKIENVSPPQQREFFFGFGRCYYHAGQYEKAIHAIAVAKGMNRHYPGVHKYKALALEKLGKLDEAIQAMQEGVLYETPWDENNQSECIKFYDELVAKRG